MSRNWLFTVLATAGLVLCLNGCVPHRNRHLVTAVQNADLTGVRQLLTEGADPNATNRDGVPVLLLAASMGTAEIVQALLDKGADANATSRGGETALMLAAERTDEATVAILLKRGVQAKVRDAKGDTALSYALRSSKAGTRAASMIETLGRAGVTANAKEVAAIQNLLSQTAPDEELKAKVQWFSRVRSGAGSLYALPVRLLSVSRSGLRLKLEASFHFTNPIWIQAGGPPLPHVAWISSPGSASTYAPVGDALFMDAVPRGFVLSFEDIKSDEMKALGLSGVKPQTPLDAIVTTFAGKPCLVGFRASGSSKWIDDMESWSRALAAVQRP